MKDKDADHIVQRLAKYICDANAEIMRFTKSRSHIHHTGAEVYVNGYIANRIFSENLLIGGEYCDYVRLEVGVADYLDAKGRFDIVCYNSDDVPLLVIEVKRYFSTSDLKNDAARLISVVKARGVSFGGSLKGAALIGITSDWGNSRAAADEQLERVEASIRNYEDGIHTWGGICEEPVLIEGDGIPKKVTGFAIVIKG